ncbi:BsuBI/PstI family type II restriction endonuclease [Clavibacter sp. VKM Ac-2872]|uniref:BsuBI/PstI family type II restriction endonuclease n=1 Tax=Clavibacter sp. VKM Ac-2872 TaxID=2783812 RepID=UPI00351B4B37
MSPFLPVVPVELCADRLQRIFPREGFDTVFSSPLAAAAVAAMIYLGAVHDPDADTQRWMRPSMVMWLNDAALEHGSDEQRDAWYEAALGGKKRVETLFSTWGVDGNPRYADNTRETLRDETLPKWRENGAVLTRGGLPTSSSLPRWALESAFADLFDPDLEGEALETQIDYWVATHLSATGRLRAMGARRRSSTIDAVYVNLPTGDTRQLEPGLASEILKGVVEQWARNKLRAPLVLTISEPGDKIYLADRRSLQTIGIDIDPGKLLPDALLVDTEAEPLQFWVIEAVATDGPIDEPRKQLLLDWADQQGIPPNQCHFLTAFESRHHPAARRRLKDLANDTYAWFLDDPGSELVWRTIEQPPTPAHLAALTLISRPPV